MRGWPLWWRLLLVSALWGSAFPLLRLAAGSMPPFALACARGAVGASAVLLWLWWSGALRGLGPGLWRHALLLGTTNGWLPNVMTAAALATVPAAQGALIQAAAPLLVAAGAALLLPAAERPGRRGLLGLILGFCGIAAVIGPGVLAAGADARGVLLMLGTAASYATGTLYVRAVRPGAAAPLVLGQQLVSAAGAGALAASMGAPGAFQQPGWVWGIVLLLGVFASAIPVTLFTALVQRARATDAALVGYGQPLFAALLGAALLGEWPAGREWLGGAVVLAGVWLATTARAPVEAVRAEKQRGD